MHTRSTSDYSPCKKGSREENMAIVARREMMHILDSRIPKKEKRRKTWRERMAGRAKGFKDVTG